MDASVDVKTKILAWLADEFTVSVESLPKNAPVDWAIKVESKTAKKVAFLVQKPKSKNTIALVMGIALSPKHKEAFRALPARERTSFAVDLLTRLLSLCPMCKVAPQPNVNSLDRIVISRELLVDTLDRQGLMDSAITIINMFMVAVLKFNELSSDRSMSPTVEGYM